YLGLRVVVGGRDRFGRRFTLVRGGFGGCPPPARRKRFGLPLVVGSTLGGSDRPGPLLVLGRGTGGHPAGRRVVGAHGREDVGIGPFLVRATLPGRRGIAVHPPAADRHADDPRQEHAQRGEGREGRQLVEDAPGVKTLVHQRDEPANRAAEQARQPASNQVMARSPRRSGSRWPLASARPSSTPHTATAMMNRSSSDTLKRPAFVCHALISAPWIKRTTTMAAAYTTPRSIQLVMGNKRSEYRQEP